MCVNDPAIAVMHRSSSAALTWEGRGARTRGQRRAVDCSWPRGCSNGEVAVSMAQTPDAQRGRTERADAHLRDAGRTGRQSPKSPSLRFERSAEQNMLDGLMSRCISGWSRPCRKAIARRRSCSHLNEIRLGGRHLCQRSPHQGATILLNPHRVVNILDAPLCAAASAAAETPTPPENRLRPAPGMRFGSLRHPASMGSLPPPPLPSRTDWTRLVPPPVLTGHAALVLTGHAALVRGVSG